MSMAARVRHHISERKKPFSPKDIWKDLGLSNGTRVRNVIQDMFERGEIERLEYGKYRYLGYKPGWSDRAEDRKRIHRAMHIKGIFTSEAIAMLSDVTLNWVRKVIRKLILAGDIERIGFKNVAGGGREHVYRVCHRDNFHRKYIRNERG